MGNRGILHDENKRIIRASRNTMWLICRLEFKGRKRPLMSPGTYTELFFLDEAVALAAGHRPCGECRRAQYRAFIEAVNDGVETRLDGPRDLDRRLNDSRRAPRTAAPLADLPDGVFITLGDDEFRARLERLLASLVARGLLRFYGDSRRRNRNRNRSNAIAVGGGAPTWIPDRSTPIG